MNNADDKKDETEETVSQTQINDADDKKEETEVTVSSSSN